MTDQELKDEMAQDMMMEAREAYNRESRMQDDLEYCLEQHQSLIDNIEQLKCNLVYILASYGHEVSLSELDELL